MGLIVSLIVTLHCCCIVDEAMQISIMVKGRMLLARCVFVRSAQCCVRFPSRKTCENLIQVTCARTQLLLGYPFYRLVSLFGESEGLNRWCLWQRDCVDPLARSASWITIDKPIVLVMVHCRVMWSMPIIPQTAEKEENFKNAHQFSLKQWVGRHSRRSRVWSASPYAFCK